MSYAKKIIAITIIVCTAILFITGVCVAIQIISDGNRTTNCRSMCAYSRRSKSELGKYREDIASHDTALGRKPHTRIKIVDFTDEATKEAAKKITTWYVNEETIRAVVTRYSPRESGCGRGICLTANGKIAEEGVTTSCPRGVTFETRAWIEHHQYVCQDHTNRRFDGRFDVFTTRFDQARKEGIKTEDVTLVYPQNHPKIIHYQP